MSCSDDWRRLLADVRDFDFPKFPEIQPNEPQQAVTNVATLADNARGSAHTIGCMLELLGNAGETSDSDVIQQAGVAIWYLLELHEVLQQLQSELEKRQRDAAKAA